MTGSKLQRLEVRLGQVGRIATISIPVGNVSDFKFEYEGAWRKKGFAVSPYLPLEGKIDSLNVRNFLENLLPEGKGLEDLLTNTTISRGNIFGLIRRIGAETSGALSFVEADTPRVETTFRPVTEQELETRLTVGADITYWDGKTRLSVAGVQSKLNILEMDGRFGFGEGELCSNTIYKFELGNVPNIVANEAFNMALARHAGLEAASTRIRSIGVIRTLVVERFDRRLLQEHAKVQRRHIIDGCQATNLPSSYKYERQNGDEGDGALYRDGVDFPKLFQVQTSEQAVYHRQLVDWMLFNVLIRNYDAHGKNISFLVGRDGLKMAPLYDLVNIEALYQQAQDNNGKRTVEQLSRDSSSPRFYAMSIGDYGAGARGNFTNPITAYALADFATEFGISLERMQLLARNMVKQVLTALPKAYNDCLEFGLSSDERAHLELCREITTDACAELKMEADQIPAMKEFI